MRSRLPVDLPAMPDGKDENSYFLILNPADDAVITNTISPPARFVAL
jgi:hypothetical protein